MYNVPQSVHSPLGPKQGDCVVVDALRAAPPVAPVAPGSPATPVEPVVMSIFHYFCLTEVWQKVWNFSHTCKLDLSLRMCDNQAFWSVTCFRQVSDIFFRSKLIAEFISDKIEVMEFGLNEHWQWLPLWSGWRTVIFLTKILSNPSPAPISSTWAKKNPYGTRSRPHNHSPTKTLTSLDECNYMFRVLYKHCF